MELLPVPVEKHLSDYEELALREIELWKQRDMGWFGKVVGGINHTVGQVTDLVRKIPGVDWTIDNVVAGLLKLINEFVQDTVWRDAIYKEYREAALPVNQEADIQKLDLQQVDRLLKGLDTKYRALAAVEGAATGYAGLSGIVPDIVSLVALNLRAVGEYATYCGFDIRDPEERLFAMQLLDSMSHPSDTAKQVSLAPVIRISRKLAREQAAQVIQQHALTRAIRNAARSLGIHLVRAKMAQVVPVTGAVIGSSFNAYYTSKVCDAAYFLYRERFLLHKQSAVK